ncbi:DNA repair protein endonuclease SAE2/CtIP C-terminus-domain-containing protein [Trametes elegans]|nr:DNA repair protein endonuclease SAE2/CtIP C-terminus-domain-containing protein [Trametes elegans]
MPKGPTAGPPHFPTKQIQLLESKLNKLRWINNDLNKQVFDAAQRGHRLAAKLGHQNIEDAEAALATQAPADAQSQLEQLIQRPSDELAEHVQALQAELVSHVQLSKSTLGALGDALEEMNVLREENLALRKDIENARTKAAPLSSKAGQHTEEEYLRAELDALKQRYADLEKAKKANDEKHAEDFTRWRNFKNWLLNEELKAQASERPTKRRKIDPEDEDEGDKENGPPTSPSRLSKSERERRFGRIREQFLKKGPRLGPLTPKRVASPVPGSSRKKAPVLGTRNLNSSSSSTPSSSPSVPVPSPSTPPANLAPPPRRAKRSPSIEIPQLDVHASSETEPDSQPTTYVYPSQLDVIAPSSHIPQKRPRSPVHDPSSSETEQESQGPDFVYPSQIVQNVPAHIPDMTPKSRPIVRGGVQLLTPISVARPQQPAKAKNKGEQQPVSSSSTVTSGASIPSDPFRTDPAPPQPADVKLRLPGTPVSLGPKKGKEWTVKMEDSENDENAAPSTSSARLEKKYPDDYSVFKGRGRYGEELKAGKDTINALYQLDPEQNDGVGYQYGEVVRDKQRRKKMHGGDCECCRDYYEVVGPLPSRAQAPLWRSPESTPPKPPRGDSSGEVGVDAAIEEHKGAISRHREHWPRAKTPPGYWNIGFPDTQEVAAMNAEAVRMHEQKRAMVAEEAERGGRFKRR